MAMKAVVPMEWPMYWRSSAPVTSSTYRCRFAEPCHFDAAPAPEPPTFFTTPAPTNLLHAWVSWGLTSYIPTFYSFKKILSLIRSCSKFTAPAPAPAPSPQSCLGDGRRDVVLGHLVPRELPEDVVGGCEEGVVAAVRVAAVVAQPHVIARIRQDVAQTLGGKYLTL